jgi:hypothetical protein
VTAEMVAGVVSTSLTTHRSSVASGFLNARRSSSRPVTTRRWAQTPAAPAQFAAVAGLAMLVLVVHSAHVHAATHRHDANESAPNTDGSFGRPSLDAREFIDHPGAIAGCMTLEFSAPRTMAPALVGAALLELPPTLANTGQRFAKLRVEMARPPPGVRRQALLGVFLS